MQQQLDRSLSVLHADGTLTQYPTVRLYAHAGVALASDELYAVHAGKLAYWTTELTAMEYRALCAGEPVLVGTAVIQLT